MADKDILLNAVTSSHDYRLSKIDHQEDVLISGTQKSTEMTVGGVHEQEIKRNRKRVVEICGFLEKVTMEVDSAVENAY